MAEILEGSKKIGKGVGSPIHFEGLITFMPTNVHFV